MIVFVVVIGNTLVVNFIHATFLKPFIVERTRPDTRHPVADGWEGAVMQKPLGIQKCDGWTDGPTDRHTDLPTDTARCRVACPRLKRTRPDTRLPKSRAGGQGLYLRSSDHLGRSSEVEEIKS